MTKEQLSLLDSWIEAKLNVMKHDVVMQGDPWFANKEESTLYNRLYQMCEDCDE